MSNATFTTEPFTCPSCIKKIETAVGKMTGVQEVTVGFNSSRVKVAFDESAVEADKIRETIEGLGYQVLKSKVA